ncbi:MCE family protein [Nocardia barduliensis]|uniref:MCE family protein n=1 Tax=Nocardia barduliensis TaxID=2736643 RepID=UPI0015720F02|nr:MCE family protein [Nocardia barduliensis]
MKSKEFARQAIRTLRQPIESHRRSVLGVVALAVLTAVPAAALAFDAADVGRVSYEVEFAQAAGIRPGDSVTVAGVPVGTVQAQRLAGDRVVVTLEVDESVALGSETGAAIKLTTLLGARYVELRPAGAGALPERRITLRHTSVPYDLQQALENATVTFEQIDAQQIGKSLDSLAAQLDGVPAVLPGLLENMRALSTIIGDRRGELGALLAGTQRLTTVVTEQRADLAAITTQGRDLLREIVARRDAIQRLMDGTRRLADQLRTLVVDDRPKLDELITGLNGLLGSLARNDQLLRNTLEILPVPVRNFANASGTGNEVDFTAPAGPLIDSWMCAISGRAEQVDLPPYYEDCR